MKTLRIIVLGFVFSGFVNQVQANDFEVALSSDTAQFTFRSDSSLIGWGGADLGFSFFYNEEDDILGQISLVQTTPPSKQSPLTLGVGVKAYLGQVDITNENIGGLGIGGEIRYTFPDTMPMAVYLNGYIAPDITSFSDTEEIREFTLGFQIEISPQTIAFVGVRNIEVDTDSGTSHELDDDRAHIGVRLTF
jgi:hypothetical protein